jgi:hypothetical protein
VTIGDSEEIKLRFHAPSVTKDTTLAFKLTITDDGGKSSSDQANVEVLNTANVNESRSSPG